MSSADFGPYVAFSTFADWSDVAKAYRLRAATKAVVTPDIQLLTDELTKGIVEPKLQAQALYNWVARNVRYVGVFLGLGGFVPRESAEILKSKYGDCKDHTVLLDALLRAKNIDSTPVLIGTSNSFQLPTVPLMGAFNHAITYIPALDMYLDSTASFNRFGTLPNMDAGKPVLLVNTGKVSATPINGTNVDLMHDTVDLTLDAKGALTGRSVLVLKGSWEANLRSWVAAFPAGDKDKLVTRWLGSTSKNTGTFESTDPNDLSVPFAFSADYKMQDAISMEAPGAFKIPTALSYSNIHDAISLGDLSVPTRKTRFICGSGTRLIDVTLNLPPDMTVLSLPKNVSFQDKTTSFTATYMQEGQKIKVMRKLVRARDQEYCEPSEWGDIGKAHDAIARDAKAQVLFK